MKAKRKAAICPNCGTIFYAATHEDADQILDAHLDNCREPHEEGVDYSE